MNRETDVGTSGPAKSIFAFLMILQLPIFIYLFSSNFVDEYFQKNYGWEPPAHTSSHTLRLALLLVMTFLYHFKYIYYFLVINTYSLSIPMAIAANVLRAVHTFIPFLVATRNTNPLGLPEVVAALAFVAGFFLEFVPEYQRHIWKQDSRNKGKPYTGSAFAWAQHINYFGFCWVNFAFFLFAGLRMWAYAIFVIHALSFILNGIPVAQKSGKARYGKDPKYVQYTANTAKFIPYVY
eukprot:Phypoly_transcript_17586.p1 GENE.Phypoly_transcript_17586~~Phypoly_transcript_17586.p1  ORF type:complete len:237 (+),score=38.03 Phypoly_transcript_17586:60-770(+)